MDDNYQYQTSWRTMFLIFAGVLLLLYLATGCYTAKKADQQVKKAFYTHTEQTVTTLRILAPCITSGHSFTTDSAAYKESLDSLYNTRGWYETLIRGIETLPPHPIQQDTLCPEMAKELILANQKYDWAEQYIIDLTDKFDHLKPIIINNHDTTEDLSKVMAKDFELLEARKLYSAQTEELLSNKQERDKAIKASAKKTWWMVGEGGLILLLLVLLYFILKGKATTKLL